MYVKQSFAALKNLKTHHIYQFILNNISKEFRHLLRTAASDVLPYDVLN